MPPELLARRRAAAPPSQPYQPIAGWSMPPAPPTGSNQTVVGGGFAGPPTQGTPLGGQPAGPTNGFAAPPTGGFARSGPPVSQGAPAPISPRAESFAGSGGGGGGRSRRSALLGLGAVVVVAGIVFAALSLPGGDDSDPGAKPAATPSTAAAVAPVALTFEVSSHDPVGGEGFRKRAGGLWDTPRYTRPSFGNLKKGVGLVLDLGSAKAVKTVSFDTSTGPFSVELRALNQEPSGYSIGDLVGESVTADGATKLDGSKGGKHQYWMIWVTSTNDSFKVAISDIKADQ